MTALLPRGVLQSGSPNLAVDSRPLSLSMGRREWPGPVQPVGGEGGAEACSRVSQAMETGTGSLYI